MSQRWSPRWLRSSQTSSSSTTNGSSSSKSFLCSEAALSDFKAVHYILPSTSIENPGERHCCNLRQLQLRNHLEVWPLSALAIQEAGIQVSNLSKYFLDKLWFSQVCGLRPDEELCSTGSSEKEMPSEMPTRGTQGLGILLNNEHIQLISD